MRSIPPTRCARTLQIVAVSLLALAAGTRAQAPDQTTPPQDPPLVAQRLELTGAKATEPLFRDRLFPLSSDRMPGDAAPIYLRLRHELSADTWKELEESGNWLDLPLGDFPVGEARALVDRRRRHTEQLAFGARRATCDWNYTVPEQRRQVVEILLPDMQSMRVWGRMLAVKARVEIAECRFTEAADTIETGISFGRDVAEGPFLINDLVGVAICGMMLDRVDEWIEQPGSPNLYWPLTALPVPLVSLREGLETEQRLVEFLVPELVPSDERRTDAEWKVVLDRLVDRLHELDVQLFERQATSPPPRSAVALRAELLPAAREDLRQTWTATEAEFRAVSDDEVIVRYLQKSFLTVRDALFAATYLPFPDSGPVNDRGEAMLKEFEQGPIGFLGELQPVVRNAVRAEARLTRQVAALRVIEAIRMHLVEGDGTLPATLDAIQVVPIPLDPVTGKPFEYGVSNGVATLRSPAPEGSPATMGLLYELSVRP